MDKTSIATAFIAIAMQLGIREALIRERERGRDFQLLNSDQLTKVAKPIFGLSASRCLNLEIEDANVMMCAIEGFPEMVFRTVNLNVKASQIYKHSRTRRRTFKTNQSGLHLINNDNFMYSDQKYYVAYQQVILRNTRKNIYSQNNNAIL